MTKEVAEMWADILEGAPGEVPAPGRDSKWEVWKDGEILRTARECFREALLDLGVGWSSRNM